MELHDWLNTPYSYTTEEGTDALDRMVRLLNNRTGRPDEYVPELEVLKLYANLIVVIDGVLEHGIPDEMRYILTGEE